MVFLHRLNFMGLACLILGLALGVSGVRAQELPYLMVIDGLVSPSSDGKLVPSLGDTVLVINLGSGKEEATASFANGGFQVIMDRTRAFNGTLLVIRLKRGGTIYDLRKADNSEATLAFVGAPLLPQRVPITLSMASVRSTTPTTPGTPTTPTSPTTNTGSGTGTVTPASSIVVGDINGDGKVDEADISMLKDIIAGRTRVTDLARIDLNNDKVVNTRDLIDLIRQVRLRVQPEGISVTVTVRRK